MTFGGGVMGDIVKFDRADETAITTNPDDLPCFVQSITPILYEKRKQEAATRPPPTRQQAEQQFVQSVQKLTQLIEETRIAVDRTNDRVDMLARRFYQLASELASRGWIG